MLRASRKRTRNKMTVRKGHSNRITDVSSLSTNDTTDGVQPSSVKLGENNTTIPEGSGIIEEANNSGTTSPSRVSQSASSSPKRFRSSSSIPNRSVSPARFYREREQSELQNLNDRLFSHVETVKHLKSENASLRLQLEGLEILRAEKDARKHFNQSDIETLQDLLDKSRQETNNLDQVLRVTRKERDSLRQSLAMKDEDMALLEIRVENIKSASEQCGKMETELKTLKETLKEREADAKRLSDDLIKEKMTRQRLEEEAQMNKSRYIKEIEDTSARMNRHLETTDQKLEAGYEVLVNDALVSVREQNVRDLAALRDELTTVYQTKLSEWKSKAERSNADLISTRKELKASRTEVDAIRAQATRLKMDIAAYKVQIQEDQTKLTELKNESEREACQLQREMVILKQELSEVKDELEEMGGANMRLEREIATYRVLLDDLDSKSPFAKKGKDNGHRDEMECPDTDLRDDVMSEFPLNQDAFLRTNEMDKGVSIDSVDADGRYLSVINRADHLVDMCLWTIVQSCYGKKVKFEIPYSTPVMSDQHLYIWGDGEGPFKDRPGCDQIMSLPDDIDTRHFYRIHSAIHTTTTTNNNKNSLDSSSSGSSSSNNTTITDNNNDALSEMTGTDAIHISMRRNRWLRKPQSMNIRLEDGDSQLQAKCDLTTITKHRGFGQDPAVVHAGKQNRKLTSLYCVVPGIAHERDDVVNGGAAQSIQSYDHARGATRLAGGRRCVKDIPLAKDGCVTM